jgi:hypothetical protein
MSQAASEAKIGELGSSDAHTLNGSRKARNVRLPPNAINRLDDITFHVT